LFPGCSDSPTQPATLLGLSLTVQPTTGSPADSVSVKLRLVNASKTQVWYCSGCGCGNSTRIKVFDPSGGLVALYDPNGPTLGCADQVTSLAPNGTLTNHVEFNGTLYVTNSHTYPSPTYDAPSGTYEVIGVFYYSKTEGWASDSVRTEAKFVWKGKSSP
jgi:hypothetical protein